MTAIETLRGFIARVVANPTVDHALRANERFVVRLGPQSSAGIAYYSMLSMVPILMFAFAVLGGTLTVLRPDLLAGLQAEIISYLPDSSEYSSRVIELIDQALSNWRSVGLAGLVTGMWWGATWARNLKRAIRGQTRSEFDTRDDDRTFVVDQFANLGLALLLLVGLAVTMGFSSVATRLSSQILQWLDWHGSISEGVLNLSSLVVSLVAGFALFWFLLGVLPRNRMPRRAVAIGSLAGALSTAGLQNLVTVIAAAFSRNAAASLFGPLIVLLLFFNLFATLILRIAAWVGTYDPSWASPAGESVHQPAPPPDSGDVRAISARGFNQGRHRGFRIGAVVGGGLTLAVCLSAAAVGRGVRSARTALARRRNGDSTQQDS